MMKYSLNLSPRYAADWGPWEVAREFICNAIDASENGMVIGGDAADRLTIETPTAPNFAELFMIGEGTKAKGGSTIGQFGEGAKIAALCVSRTVGSSIAIEIPGHRVTFGFEPVMGSECLHAYIEETENDRKGCLVDIRMPGIGRAHMGRILTNREAGTVGRAAKSSVRIYCKGVWITDMAEEAIYDWNLNNLEINRDRGMVDRLSLTITMAGFIGDNIDSNPEMAERIVDSLKSLECSSLQWTGAAKTGPALRDAFYRMYGEKAVISSDKGSVNESARQAGYEPKRVHDKVEARLREAGVKGAEQVIARDHNFTSVDTAEYRQKINWLRRLDKTVDAPDVTVLVFAESDVAAMGFANLEDRHLWLRESLFRRGNEFELVRTYLHEVAHFISGASDGTVKFECGLDYIAGQLGLMLLSGKAATGKAVQTVPVDDEYDPFAE